MTGTLGREVISTRQRKIAELARREPELTLTLGSPTELSGPTGARRSVYRRAARPLSEEPGA